MGTFLYEKDYVKEEETKKRWQEKKKKKYRKKKKGFNDLHNHDGVATQLEVDILEWSHMGLRKL